MTMLGQNSRILWASVLTGTLLALVASGASGEPIASSGIWDITHHECPDGQSRAFLSSLPKGETNTGGLRSKPFPAPEFLSFWLCGHNRQGRNRVTCVDAGSGKVVAEARAPQSDTPALVTWNLSHCHGAQICIQLEDTDAGTGFAWLAFGGPMPEVVAIPENETDAAWDDWAIEMTKAPPFEVDGIPYIKFSPWTTFEEGASADIALRKVEAKVLFVLGGQNSHDECNPAWGGGDGYRNLFLGERAGELRIAYASGQVDTIPLVFGYTVWWRKAIQFAPAPISTDPGAQALLDDSLCVINGHDVWKPGNGDKPYYLRINLRSEPVVGIEIEDEAGKIGYPMVEGLTFTGVTNTGGEAPEDVLLVGAGEITLPQNERYAIDSANPYPASRQEAVKAFSRLFTTYASDIDTAVIEQTEPEVTPAVFDGPDVTFFGPPEAAILTNVYYENAQQILERIDDTGMVHESAKGADNYSLSFGTYAPGLQAFYDSSFTRLRSLTLLSNIGFREKVNAAIGFFDTWLLYFPDAFPELQLNGKPVPGHATVVANKPHLYFDELSKAGWPTRHTTRELGNQEDDGHGMLMLSRWRAWLKQGQTKEWVDSRWRAINEAAEYIPWCLDNPELSLSEHGLLYSESEGGLSQISMFCNYNCYLGLLAYADMAEATSRSDKAARWRLVADGLMEAMNAYYPAVIEPWGDVWDPTKTADWHYGHATLAPVVIGMDYYGYDVASRLPGDWLARTKNTYKMQLTRNQPPYCAPAGMGYGQCYITEAALLLDQMQDAGPMVDWTTLFCFAPRQKHPYRVPEGATVAEDYSQWRRWGDLGNLYQVGEVIYTIHLLLGIDDIDVTQLKLMPRVPAAWDGVSVSKWPVRTMSGGQSTLVNLDYTLRRQPNAIHVNITLDNPIDAGALRIGPVPTDWKSLQVLDGAKAIPHSETQSGDSRWVWVDLGGNKTQYEFTLAPKTS